MQVIILAAGMGRRLGEYTRNNTKCMVPVNGTPLIDRLLSQISRYTLNRVVLVVGHEGQKLMEYLGNEQHGLKIEYVNNPIYDRTNNIYSLALAKDKLMEDDTLLIESDLIFDDGMFNLMLENSFPNLVLVAKYESWMDGTMVKIDQDNNIVNFVPKAALIIPRRTPITRRSTSISSPRSSPGRSTFRSWKPIRRRSATMSITKMFCASSPS